MRAFLVLLLCMVSGAGQAQVFDRLYAGSAQLVLAQPLQWVAAAKGSVGSPDDFAAPGNWNFQPYTADTTLPTSDRQEAWARFTLPATETSQTWFIRIPRPAIVKVSLFSSDALGNWRVQSAGESIAPAQWPVRTRTPSFELQTSGSGAQTYYLRFEHRSAIPERPLLLSPIDYVDGAARVGIVIGLLLGMFGLLAILCLAAYLLARNTVFLWFGSFVVALMLLQLVLVGYGGWHMWPNSVRMNQMMAWFSASLTLAAGTWFCARASYARDSHIWIYRLLGIAAAGSLLMALLAAGNIDFVPRGFRAIWVTAVTVLAIGGLAWMSLRGQTQNLLLLIGLLPIGLAAMVRLTHNIGWATHVEIAEGAGIVSAELGLLWIFLVLAWRSREALLSTERAAALATYDPPTGLMLLRPALMRLPQMLLRASRLDIGCGVLMLRWVMQEQTASTLKPELRSAALARIGAILRRVARDIDTVARYDDDHFMILVEGPVSRDALSTVSTQIIAACMRSAEKLEHPDAFNLHIAIWQATPGTATDQEVIESLKARLNQMSFGTRRRVQFVDVAVSEPAGQNEEISQRKQAVLEKIRSLESPPNLPDGPPLPPSGTPS